MDVAGVTCETGDIYETSMEQTSVGGATFSLNSWPYVHVGVTFVVNL